MASRIDEKLLTRLSRSTTKILPGFQNRLALPQTQDPPPLDGRECGVLAAALFEADGQLHAAVNARSVDPLVSFGKEQPVSPQKLGAADKAKRWQEVWFHTVTVSP